MSQSSACNLCHKCSVNLREIILDKINDVAMAYSTHDWTARATMISVTNQRAQAEAATCNQVWVSERKEEGFKLGQKKNDWENATTLMKVRLKVHQRRCEGSVERKVIGWYQTRRWKASSSARISNIFDQLILILVCCV